MTRTPFEAKSVGLFGSGLLGTALAKRLIAAGFSVSGYDPDPAALDRLQLLGGTTASPEHIVQTCPRLLFCLPGPPQVQETIERIAAQLSPGTIILDTTTGDPKHVEATAQRLATAGVFYLDSEIGGSSKQVASGEAIVICGGDNQAYENSRDILSAISKRIFHIGEAGTGTRMKLVLNLVIGLHRAVLAESLEFARTNGIDPGLALEILKSGPAYSKAMDVKGLKMLTGDFTPEARLAQHLKDVRLILKTGEELGSRLPLSQVHESLLVEAVNLGLGSDDNSAVIRVFAKKPGQRT